MFKKIFAITGITVTIIHMTYYAIKPYDTLYLFLGFGILYLVFVLPMKWIK
ncbi:MAG: hypothetical protein WC254_04615 [Candidatus Woesearchaeota archaeon]|jgi:hypothetical protein